MPGDGNTQPILIAVEAIPPRPGENWRAYRVRVAERLAPLRRRVARGVGLDLAPLYAANALYGQAAEEVVHKIRAGILGPGASLLEWGEELSDRQMGSGISENGLGTRVRARSGLTGRGISVAVLDSGIDARHPFLRVAAAVSTCPEAAGVAGWHGTHCAGLIASLSPRYPGLAPGVDLLDIKVSRSSGHLHPAWLARGIDAALDARADILSISVGLNGLPASIAQGHAWDCRGGRCLLCRAVDHAVRLGALVVAAAGNNHLLIRSLRERGVALPASAELLCPARARESLSVGAVETGPPARLWPHSSRATRRSGRPQLVAPGVNLASTVPVPQNGRGLDPLAIFGTGSGTSLAAAVAAGAAALIIQRRRAAGLPALPPAVRRELFTLCVPLPTKDGMPRRLDPSLFASKEIHLKPVYRTFSG